jgi:uncharacterized protein (UPF0276 family)
MSTETSLLSIDTRRLGPPELGVGITFSSAIESILDRHPELIDVVEVEPQTTWLESPSRRGRLSRHDDVAAYLRDLPFRKLVHSIGVPVGGTTGHDPEQIGLLRDTIDELGSPWASEHLSFNRTETFHTGFFLPPRQSDHGVTVAVDSIRRLRSELEVPLAFETGVNYLARRTDEIEDGAFAAAVAEGADCGILLDLHNIYTNAVNGRQPVDEFVAQLPLERVWEVHLAGGFWMDGYWLDAHSGSMPTSLVDQARNIVSRLPNLGAIIFEIYPSFVDSTGVDEICRQLELIRELWALRGTAAEVSAGRPATELAGGSGTDSATPAMWEAELGSLVIGRSPADNLGRQLAGDPGVVLVQKLAMEFRASMIASNLRRTIRLLILALGEDVLRMILAEYRNRVTPQMFAATEARTFAAFIQELGVGVPQLAEVLEFELAVLETLVDGRTRLVRFGFDPLPMLLALGDGKLPDAPGRVGPFEIEITPDTARAIDAAQPAGIVAGVR